MAAEVCFREVRGYQLCHIGQSPPVIDIHVNTDLIQDIRNNKDVTGKDELFCIHWENVPQTDQVWTKLTLSPASQKKPDFHRQLVLHLDENIRILSDFLRDMNLSFNAKVHSVTYDPLTMTLHNCDKEERKRMLANGSRLKSLCKGLFAHLDRIPDIHISVRRDKISVKPCFVASEQCFRSPSTGLNTSGTVLQNRQPDERFLSIESEISEQRAYFQKRLKKQSEEYEFIQKTLTELAIVLGQASQVNTEASTDETRDVPVSSASNTHSRVEADPVRKRTQSWSPKSDKPIQHSNKAYLEKSELSTTYSGSSETTTKKRHQEDQVASFESNSVRPKRATKTNVPVEVSKWPNTVNKWADVNQGECYSYYGAEQDCDSHSEGRAFAPNGCRNCGNPNCMRGIREGLSKPKPGMCTAIPKALQRRNYDFGICRISESMKATFYEPQEPPTAASTDTLHRSSVVLQEDHGFDDFDMEMFNLYRQGGNINAQLQALTHMYGSFCQEHECLVNIQEVHYTLTSRQGRTRQWIKIDQYPPGDVPPEVVEHIPYNLTPTGDSSFKRRKIAPSPRTTTNLRDCIFSSEVRVKKDVSEDPMDSQAMHLLYQLKEFLDHNNQMWDVVDDVLSKDTVSMPRSAIGLDTILCLDNSGTMPRQSFVQLKKIANDFITGIESVAETYGIEENVSIVTLGSQPQILHPLSNDYGSLKDALGGVCNMGGFMRLPPRLICVTEGITVGKVEHMCSKEETTMFLFTLKQLRRRSVQANVVYPLIVVPYGDAHVSFLESSANSCEGIMVYDIKETVNYQRTKRLSAQICKYMEKETSTGKPLFTDIDKIVSAVGADFTAEERLKIADDVRKKQSEIGRVLGITNVFDNLNVLDGLPPLGTRVVRGPEWKWEDQDSGGPGTVFNHGDDGESLWVMWDNGYSNVFRYGFSGHYDVLITDDQPRMNDDEGATIDIGMQVERGPDWQEYSGDHNYGRLGNYGTVIRHDHDRVMVIWHDGAIDHYKYGYNNKYEVSIRDPAKCLQSIGRNIPDDEKTETMRILGKNKVHTEASTWQWLDENEVWQSYSKDIDNKIQTVFSKRPEGSCLIQQNGKSFRISFKKMVQKSTEDASVVTIRRNPESGV